MRTTPQTMRNIARKHNKKKHRNTVINCYKNILKAVRKQAKSGRYGMEGRYFQVEPNFEFYIALRLLSMNTDFKVRIYCDDKEYATNGIFDYGKWSKDREWQTCIKYIINW